jgi:hypothetical protein
MPPTSSKEKKEHNIRMEKVVKSEMTIQVITPTNKMQKETIGCLPVLKTMTTQIVLKILF